jgi:hypothetical protein
MTYTQHVITTDDYRHAASPEDLIAFTEDLARKTLQPGRGEPAGTVETEWWARLPGYDVHAIDGRRWVPWSPDVAPPAHADQLACRASRQA